MNNIKGKRKYTGIFVCCAMAAVLIIFCFLTFGIWNDYKDAIINNQKKADAFNNPEYGGELKGFY